jgi:hypothetical protein
MDVLTWDAIAEWEPVLRYIAVVTDCLLSDTTPLSGVHVSFLYLETVVASSLAPAPVRSTIISFLEKHYASIYSLVHVLEFYLDPFFLGCRDASRISSIKPFVESDASECAKSTRRLLRHAPSATQSACMAQVTHVVMGTVPYLSSTGAHSDWGMVDTATLSLPHVWWHLHADGAPTLLGNLAAQVFSLVPPSASGERSFKQRSRVQRRVRNRLSDGKADMTQAILFNKQQKKRFAEGALLHPRYLAVEKQILYAIDSRQAQSASVTAADLQVAERQGGDCDNVESFAEPQTSVDQAILPDG